MSYNSIQGEPFLDKLDFSSWKQSNIYVGKLNSKNKLETEKSYRSDKMFFKLIWKYVSQLVCTYIFKCDKSLSEFLY